MNVLVECSNPAATPMSPPSSTMLSNGSRSWISTSSFAARLRFVPNKPMSFVRLPRTRSRNSLTLPTWFVI